MELSAADRIWNRAAQGEDSGEHRLDARVGDRALRALPLAHGMVMNGGVFHCVFEALSESELRAAADGYAYFGLDAAAATTIEQDGSHGCRLIEHGLVPVRQMGLSASGWEPGHAGRVRVGVVIEEGQKVVF